jgi:hypothetical protein
MSDFDKHDKMAKEVEQDEFNDRVLEKNRQIEAALDYNRKHPPQNNEIEKIKTESNEEIAKKTGALLLNMPKRKAVSYKKGGRTKSKKNCRAKSRKGGKKGRRAKSRKN